MGDDDATRKMVRVVTPEQFLKMQDELLNPLRSDFENAVEALVVSGLQREWVHLHYGVETQIIVDPPFGTRTP